MCARWGGYAQETVTDELTSKVLGLTTSYSSFTNKKASSDALYCGCAYLGNNSAIQINGGGTSKGTKPNKVIGLVSIVSGGTIKSITIELNSSKNPLLVFGNNEAFVGSDDLTGNNKGTQIASITNTTKQTIIPTENYKYVGFYSAKANYIKKSPLFGKKQLPPLPPLAPTLTRHSHSPMASLRVLLRLQLPLQRATTTPTCLTLFNIQALTQTS